MKLVKSIQELYVKKGKKIVFSFFFLPFFMFSFQRMQDLHLPAHLAKYLKKYILKKMFQSL